MSFAGLLPVERLTYGAMPPWLLLNDYEKGKQRIVFSTQSGDLTVCRRNDLYEMDFPAYDLKPVAVTQEMISAIGAKPIEAFMGRDLLCVFDSASTVTSLNPDMESLKQLDGLLLQATALGNDKISIVYPGHLLQN